MLTQCLCQSRGQPGLDAGCAGRHSSLLVGPSPGRSDQQRSEGAASPRGSRARTGQHNQRSMPAVWLRDSRCSGGLRLRCAGRPTQGRLRPLRFSPRRLPSLPSLYARRFRLRRRHIMPNFKVKFIPKADAKHKVCYNWAQALQSSFGKATLGGQHGQLLPSSRT